MVLGDPTRDLLQLVDHQLVVACCAGAVHVCAVRLVAARLGWQVVPPGSPDSAWDLYWTDTSISQERLLKLSPVQVST